MAENDQDSFAVATDQSDEANAGGATQVQEKLVELPDGRKVTGEQAAQEYRKLQSDYTKKSQELAELKNQPATPQQEELTPEVKAQLKAQGIVFQEDMEQQRAQDRLDMQLSQKESQIDGSDGRPKFDKTAVLNYMQENRIFNPDIAYEQMHKKELFDIAIKQYEDAKNGVPSVERGSATGTKPPETKVSYGKMSKKDVEAAIEQELINSMGGSPK